MVKFQTYGKPAVVNISTSK